jgi:LacI family transcriptional regulator
MSSYPWVDNNEMICDCLRVPLSSIDPNLEEVGYQGAALLSRLLSGERPPLSPIYIAPIGIVRRRSPDGIAVQHSVVAADETAIEQGDRRANTSNAP